VKVYTFFYAESRDFVKYEKSEGE